MRGRLGAMACCERIGRVAMLSVHTSPLDQPGTGDAGGMNVYVVEVAQQLAGAGRRGRDLHPRDDGDLPPTVELAPGRLVRHVTAGPFEGLGKEDLPGQLCAFTAGVMRAGPAAPGATTTSSTRTTGSPARSAGSPPSAGASPLVHTMHTMARVKNAHARRGRHARAARRARSARPRSSRPPTGSSPTPTRRRAQLVDLYAADPGQGRRRRPPASTSPLSRPGDRRGGARRARPRPRTRSSCSSSAGSSRSRRPTCCCARRPAAARARPVAARAARRGGRRRPVAAAA